MRAPIIISTLIALSLTGCAGAVSAGSASSLTCDDLADQSVDLSKGEDVELLKVRNPIVKADNTSTYKTPSGDKVALILSCTGSGVWSDGSTSPVLLKYTVDSDGDEFVGYQPA